MHPAVSLQDVSHRYGETLALQNVTLSLPTGCTVGLVGPDGVGKSTLATNVAGYWASQGHAVMLGDVDRQQSSRLWLGLRPPAARPITSWEVQRDAVVRPPKGTTHVVLDTPAGLHGGKLKEVLRIADKVLVPVQPSIFDIYATREFIDQLLEGKGADRRDIGLIGMRVDERTIAADQLRQFTDGLGLPVLGTLPKPTAKRNPARRLPMMQQRLLTSAPGTTMGGE